MTDHIAMSVWNGLTVAFGSKAGREVEGRQRQGGATTVSTSIGASRTLD